MLEILIRSSDNKHAVVDGQLQAVPVSARAAFGQQHEPRMKRTWDAPVRLPHLPDYVWIGDFPEVLAATQGASKGTMSFSQLTDMNFGMSGTVARFAGFEAGWLSTFVGEIEATFA